MLIVFILIIITLIIFNCSLEGNINDLRQHNGNNSTDNTDNSDINDNTDDTDNTDNNVQPIPAPGIPFITASDSLLTVKWPVVREAESYDVYINTSMEPPGEPIKTVYTTTAVIDELINKTIYYVWIKARNAVQTSDFSPRAHGTPWPDYEIPEIPIRPIIIAGSNQLTVTWETSSGADFYEVYINTSPTVPSLPEMTTNETHTIIKNLENDITYYIWIRAVNEIGKSDYSPPEAGTPQLAVEIPNPPSKPELIPGSREIYVSWNATEFAVTYEIWIGTSNNPNTAQKHGNNIIEREIIITGLTNETTYYIWIKAQNDIGTSDFSPSTSAKPSAFLVLPGAPVKPTVVPGYNGLTITWTAVEGALSYEIWLSETSNPANANKYGSDVTGLSVDISGLTNEKTYYVWIKSKNQVGTSGFSPVSNGIPTLTPGLYRGEVKIGNHNLNSSLSYISSNAVDVDNFLIILGVNESIEPKTLSYSGKTVEIILTGYENEKIISLNSNGSMFIVNAGVTLTLDENVTLLGRNNNDLPLLQISLSGALIMRNDSKIKGNTNPIQGTNILAGRGGGVYINNGNLTMNGGEISGNNSVLGGGVCLLNNSNFIMNGGIIRGNISSNGGGVQLISSSFTMNGGVINGNTSGVGGGVMVDQTSVLIKNNGIIYGEEFNGNDIDGIPLSNIAKGPLAVGITPGNAIYYIRVIGSTSNLVDHRLRNTTSWQTDYINTTVGTGRGLSANGRPPYL